ncbi:hypothetical protein FPV24_01325 [Carnobacterium sp. PL24RED07]|uniref:hypothetical protein n=1 Tax=unclassified Carnobacterium TaxID=257487 RepID=UPI0011ECD6C5|nr:MULTISPECIES: hypothetical protein [unclassified Carnobacterium]KAF3303769.1 hypothetical protein FPV22_01325 [Carnobacterium sp. PL26RED25]KAF3307287.1 hypothetical protein FPV24_01325 [Carnobacterium sp. PL24RED07]
MSNPTPAGRSYEFVNGLAEPNQVGLTLALVIITILGYAILKMIEYFASEKRKQGTSYKVLDLVISIFKLSVYFFIVILTIIESLSSDEVLLIEFKLCLAVFILFEIIDEIYDTALKFK